MGPTQLSLVVRLGFIGVFGGETFSKLDSDNGFLASVVLVGMVVFAIVDILENDKVESGIIIDVAIGSFSL